MFRRKWKKKAGYWKLKAEKLRALFYAANRQRHTAIRRLRLWQQWRIRTDVDKERLVKCIDDIRALAGFAGRDMSDKACDLITHISVLEVEQKEMVRGLQWILKHEPSEMTYDEAAYRRLLEMYRAAARGCLERCGEEI